MSGKTYKHILSHDVKLSCNMGELVPLGIVERLPNDRFDTSTSALLRTQPLLAPLMHKVDVSIHHWFVPTRLIWTESEDFQTQALAGTTTITAPYMTSPASTGYLIGSLADYLGIPTGVASRQHSALPFRAYAMIWNEFYRDQNLQTELVVSKASGADTTTNVLLQNACWEKDYLTSGSPTPQLGPDVVIPLTGDAPITGLGKLNQTFPNGAQNVYETDGVGTTAYASSASMGDGTANVTFFVEQDPNNAGYPNIRADLSGVSAVSMSALRLAGGMQRMKENLMRWGARYVERLMQAFHVRPQDSRLQLPEYVAGGKQTIQFSEVLSTTETEDAPIGTMKGHGIVGIRSNRHRHFAPEHGFQITLMVVKPKTVYPQALNRMWSRTTPELYFQPELAHISQQAVKNKEVYWAHTSPDATFSYQDVYDEYRRQESRVSGEFRTTLDFWHMARIFSGDPALNADFVKCVPTTRVFASANDDQLYVSTHHKIVARRLVPRFGNSFLR